MISPRFTGLALLVALLVGCQSKPPAAPPPAEQPAPEQVLQDLRRSYQQVDPHARVGLVTAVAPDVQLVAVADMDLEGIRQGDYITIIDAQQNVIANGRVVVVTDHSLHVRYDADAATRQPQQGDLAVAATLAR